MKLPTRSDLAALALELVEPCLIDEADRATVVRKRLKAEMGRWQADAVLSCFSEVCLKNKGVCGRYFVDGSRRPLKLKAICKLEGVERGHRETLEAEDEEDDGAELSESSSDCSCHGPLHSCGKTNGWAPPVTM